MGKVVKRVSLIFLAIVVLAVAAFFGLYFTRVQSMATMEQLTDYEDGYNLYRILNTTTALMTSSITASQTISR